MPESLTSSTGLFKKMKVYLTVSIDTECDKGAKWRVRQPLSFENTRTGIPDCLQPLFDKYEVKPTYLLSPEVMGDKASVDIFRSLAGRVELGTHLHSEFVKPLASFDADNTKSFQSDFPLEIERAKMISLTNLFVATFGYRPLSFRAGRFGISRHTIQILQDLGYLVDSSVTPDMFWHSGHGTYANHMGAPYQPYFPDSLNHRASGKMNLLEVPVSIVNPFFAQWPLFIKRRLNLQNRYQMIATNLLKQGKKALWLRPTYSDLDQMIWVTKMMINKSAGDYVFLCMMFHSNEFTLGTSPYSLVKKNIERLYNRLDSYLDYMRKYYNIQAIGLSEVRELIQ